MKKLLQTTKCIIKNRKPISRLQKPKYVKHTWKPMKVLQKMVSVGLMTTLVSILFTGIMEKEKQVR